MAVRLYRSFDFRRTFRSPCRVLDNPNQRHRCLHSGKPPARANDALLTELRRLRSGSRDERVPITMSAVMSGLECRVSLKATTNARAILSDARLIDSGSAVQP